MPRYSLFTQVSGILWIRFPITKGQTHDRFTLYSQHTSSYRSSSCASGWGRVSLRLGLRQREFAFQLLMEVISNCCREGCGVKVSCQSGSVRSAHSVQSALYCKSLLINLMPLAELHSRLKSVTKTKNPQHVARIRDCVGAAGVALRWIWTFWQGVFSVHLWFCRRFFYAHILTFTTLHNSLYYSFFYSLGLLI